MIISYILEKLVIQISNFQYECTICFITLQPGHPIWFCSNCYHIFHISCIQKWHSTCVSLGNNKWRCPTCQNEYSLKIDEITYYCFCGKMKNPEFKHGNLLHSCGQVCGKENKIDLRCPHFCSIQCHPGPCPSCEASLTSKCFCLKTILTVKCNTSEKSLACGKKCEKLLNCLIHNCEMLCHSNSCDVCTEIISQNCYCQKETRTVICGSLEANEFIFNCNKVCNKIKDCMNHKCEKKCHIEPCESCIYLPSNIKHCPCGKTKLEDLVNSHSEIRERTNCLDLIPTCDNICGKSYVTCEHTCSSSCHLGECPLCLLISNTRCRCQKTIQKQKCSDKIQLENLGQVIQCKNRCKVKMNCGKHRCNEFCCDKIVHLCEKVCGKILSCQLHFCTKTCHRDTCPTCTNVSFEELFCACGMEVILPPIACGQSPPKCNNICSRQHSCLHEVRHNCHNELECPPCTVLVSKECPGIHTIFYNIPCFRPVVTCGFPCNKPLSNCQHLCIKDCHFGNCTDELFKCSQLCQKPRIQCQHPCNSLCHIEDCQLVFKLCSVKIEVKCACNRRSALMICHKLQDTMKMLEPNINLSHSSTLNFYLSGSTILLICDSDCKKASRTKQNLETFDKEFKNSENHVYTSFLRDFSTSNPNFLQKIDGEFISLIKKLELSNLKKINHRFEPMNRNKRRFIHELCKYFGLNSSSCDPDPNRFVTIEATRGISKIPQIRLLTVMQKNYPHIFKMDKQISFKFLIRPNSLN